MEEQSGREHVGAAGRSVSAAQRNEGVAGLVKQTPNSIGYVELIYALQNKMPCADVKNAAGKFVKPSSASVTAAAAGVEDMPADFRVSITNAPGAAAYPISTFTWLLIPSQIEDATKRKAITDFLTWMLTDGQKGCAGAELRSAAGGGGRQRKEADRGQSSKHCHGHRQPPYRRASSKARQSACVGGDEVALRVTMVFALSILAVTLLLV